MGRPLNKKYFGNRNQGTGGNQVGGPNSNSTNYADDRIGGEGIASINWASLGTFRTTPVGLALPAPTIPGGTQAVWSALTYEVNGVVTSAGKTGLAVGWKGTSALFPGMIAVVTSVSGANAVFSILTADGGAVGNSFTSLPNGGNTNTITLTKSAGGGAAGSFVVDVNVHLIPPTIVEKGSGYTGAETFNVTVAGGMDPPAGTIVLTVDTGAVGSATNQENAILMRARLPGGTAKTVDIIRQVSTNRYKVTDGTRVGIVALKSSQASAAGEGSIRATDSAGGTYFVTKLTARKAVVTRGTGTQFATGSAVPWTFGSAVNGYSITIDNA
jgi:hypothetical protein